MIISWSAARLMVFSGLSGDYLSVTEIIITQPQKIAAGQDIILEQNNYYTMFFAFIHARLFQGTPIIHTKRWWFPQPYSSLSIYRDQRLREIFQRAQFPPTSRFAAFSMIMVTLNRGWLLLKFLNDIFSPDVMSIDLSLELSIEL